MSIFKGWRTYIINVLAAAPIVFDMIILILNTPEFQAIIPIQYVTYYALGIIVINLIMRTITTTPPGQSS